MFVTEKAPGEVQTPKLSQAIRMGAAMGIGEQHDTWVSSRGYCAVATAAYALGWRARNPAAGVGCYETHPIDYLVSRGFDRLVLSDISRWHVVGRTRLELAAYLETGGK